MAAKKKATSKAAASTAAAQPVAAGAVADAAADPPKADSKGVIDEVTLNWADLTGAKTGATSFGSNKFYRATLTEAAPGSFVVTYVYGRVGTDGQVVKETYGALDMARRKMQSKINSKLSKGYTRIEMRSEQDELAKAKAKGVEVAQPEKKKKAVTREFHPHVSNLLKLMYNSTGTAIASGLSSSAGATQDAPLGNLHDVQLDRGAEILEECEDLLAKARPARDRFIELTNKYLSNIPRRIDHARKGSKLDLDMILLNSKERVEAERQFITLLRDAHLAKEIFAQAALADDPVEVWYEGLSCSVSFVEPGTAEFKRLAELFDIGQSPKNANFFEKLKVARAWTLERNGTKSGFDAYAAKVTKQKGATGIVPGWHGTRTENLMGISRSGLLMPENLPKGVHITGKAFGLGIYHAPRWPDSGQPQKENGQVYARYNGALKSMNYTSIGGAYWNKAAASTTGFLFLEEIALGIPEVHLSACWDKHRPEKGCDYIYAKAFGNDQLAHDEIVTFDENAQRMTHLLEITHR
ncbi:MAG TPA: WGR domain-containing protein [Polyangiaceae bacterium]|nr:WGR domain-containing protein [Polyangiaceae bacterium]